MAAGHFAFTLLIQHAASAEGFCQLQLISLGFLMIVFVRLPQCLAWWAHASSYPFEWHVLRRMPTCHSHQLSPGHAPIRLLPSQMLRLWLGPSCNSNHLSQVRNKAPHSRILMILVSVLDVMNPMYIDKC